MGEWTLFDDAQPGAVADADIGAVSLGTEWWTTAQAWLVGLRVLYQGGYPAGPRTGALFRADTSAQVTPTYAMGTPANLGDGLHWHTYRLPTADAFPLALNLPYRVGVFHPQGRYAAQGGYFTSGGTAPGSTTQTRGPLRVPNNLDATLGRQGTYTYGSTLQFPQNSYNNASYFVDAIVSDTDPNAAPADTGPRLYAVGAGGVLTALSPLFP